MNKDKITQVKIFSGNVHLENRINNWLKENNNNIIDVIDVKYGTENIMVIYTTYK